MAGITHEQARARGLPLIRMEHLWIGLALCVVGVFVSLSPTAPNDFWWHLKAGELIAAGDFPTTNRFAWTLPAETPFVYQSWLGEWLFYALYQMGGLPLVVFARNLLALAAFTLVAVEAQRRSGSWRLAALAVVLAAAMTMNNLTTRTQNWSWIPFVVLLALLGRYAEGRLAPRWLAALPLLMVFWVNAHGAFVMGLLVTGAFGAGETLRRLLRQPWALNWRRLGWLYLAGGAMLAATMVNPLGSGVFGYVAQMLNDAPSQGLINEWQSPTPDNLAGAAFYLSLLGLMAAFGLGRRHPGVTDVLLVSGLAWQAFTGVRYVVWFGLAAMPILAQSLGAPRTIAPGVARRVSLRERGGGAAANLVVVAALALTVVAVQPWFKPLLPLPQPYRDLFAPVPDAPQLFSADTPVAATEHLRTEPCVGPLFNEMGYGSYLIWALYPQAQVFIDPRVELFPMALWQDYVRLTQGRDVASLLDRYGIACVMLDRVHQADLAQVMPALSGWRRTFADGRSEVWRR